MTDRMRVGEYEMEPGTELDIVDPGVERRVDHTGILLFALVVRLFAVKNGANT